jgi:hypothetical protein
MSTQYEEGKWYGWNGDYRLPVHPRTKVNFLDQDGITRDIEAGSVYWGILTGAFRVVKH